MLIDAPGINGWRKIDIAVRGILELHSHGDRLAERNAGYSGNCHVRRGGNGAGSVREAHVNRHVKEEHLQWACYHSSPNVLECDGSVKSLADATVRQARGCRGNLTSYVHRTLRNIYGHRLCCKIADRIR